ncbi:MAG: alpha/beta fold hydrolase [Thermoplasmata archaeon]
MSVHDRSIRAPDGGTLVVTEGGARTGPLVFALHGTPMSGQLYAPHAEDARRRGIRLVSYDRPGYGGSTARPGRSIASAASDVAAIADELGAERFGVWGISGGGPHALACGALLPKRTVAVVALASPAPYPAEGLDWLKGQGESNVAEFHASMKGGDALEQFLRPAREAYFSSDPDAVLREMETLLSPVDRAVFTGELRAHLSESARRGLRPGVAGWRDDDLAFVRPWGFDVKEVHVPVTLWQGKEDLFVPYAQGRWLGDRIEHAVKNLTDEDGHLTLYQHRIPSVHSWLMSYLRR